ncbi:MAG: hypothetical protein LBR66_01405 [Candidatus Symbiothrix sp.]|jgi:hypothetical protein|nr:hypothetical protein [Candidatus Symbiothrix sp.]
MKRKIFYLVCALCAGNAVFAQNSDLQRELTLEKEFSPTVRDADKINHTPELQPVKKTTSAVSFSNFTMEPSLAPYFSTFQAPVYMTDFATSQQQAYVRLGMGFLFHLDADAGYQIFNTEKTRWNIFASHRSSNTSTGYLQADEHTRMKINDNLIGTQFEHQFLSTRLTAGLQYNYLRFNDYGWLDTTMTRRRNHRLQTYIGLGTTDANADVLWQANIAYTLFAQQYPVLQDYSGGNENRILADIDLHKDWVGIAAAMTTYLYSTPLQDSIAKATGNVNYTTFVLNPYVYYEDDLWDARLGLTANIRVGGVRKILIAPKVSFRWRPTDAVLFYAIADGGLVDNSHFNVRQENRYIAPMWRVKDAGSPLDAKLGVSFSPFINTGFEIFTGYKYIKDEHFYTADSIVYDNAGVFSLGGKATYSYRNSFDISAQVVFNHWNMKHETAAWNRPIFAGDLAVGYQLPAIPIRMDLNYHLETGRKANIHGLSEKMKNIHDLKFSANYMLNSQVSLFVEANNLLFQKYDFWYGYPSQGMYCMAGASVKF